MKTLCELSLLGGSGGLSNNGKENGTYHNGVIYRV